MSALSNLSHSELSTLADQLSERYAELKARGLSLDMTRGKPCAEQLDLARALLALPGEDDFKASDGSDTRNYGGLDGLPEMKAIFAELFEVEPSQVIVGGNSSLQMMHDSVVRALLHGVPGGAAPWLQQGPIKFLCPTPGYDRHFSVCEHHGIEMIAVGMNDEGPLLEAVESLVAGDAAIKGMWCVPKHSNPTGTTYSDRVVARLSAMPAKAPDFRLFWDNAYAVHDLESSLPPLANVIAACAAAGHPNRPLVFASTSKVSFAGAGVAAMASSPDNVADVKRHLAMQTIGPDKVNQLRHVRFFKDYAGLVAHMKRHAEILAPKFALVDQIFERELGGKGIAAWTKPRGGYFTSLDTLPGCATQVVRLAAEAGIKLTAAGATFPYGRDPQDRNIRIAPSLPPLDQIRAAMDGVALCVQLASVQKLLG